MDEPENKKQLLFAYGEEEMAYLKSKDKKLGEVIDQLGFIERPVQDDLFSAIVNSIVGQQISTAAHKTVWKRMILSIGMITPESVSTLEIEQLQQHGISFRKAEYISDFAQKVASNEFDLSALDSMSDAEVIKALSSLRGIGEWTAEMIMALCMQRPDILSYGDLAILRGMRMLYHHRSIDRTLFEKYRRRYSPYGTVASIYLWAISAGAVEGMRDYAPAKKRSVKIP